MLPGLRRLHGFIFSVQMWFTVFFLAGEPDGRVNPAHSRRMTARLQATTASEHPILVRLSASSGHGRGTGLTKKSRIKPMCARSSSTSSG